jgi:hypothetical protein
MPPLPAARPPFEAPPFTEGTPAEPALAVPPVLDVPPVAVELCPALPPAASDASSVGAGFPVVRSVPVLSEEHAAATSRPAETMRTEALGLRGCAMLTLNPP